MSPLLWDRIIVATGVAYAGLVSIPLMIGYPELSPFYFVGMAVVTLPLALRRPGDFRIACGVAALLLVPLALFGVFFALFVYLPAMLPLAMAAMPPPRRHRREKLVGTAIVLTVALLVFVVHFRR